MGPLIAGPRPQTLRTSAPQDPGERAARLVPHLSLADGLRICLSLADSGSPSFQSAAVRWHSCFCSRASDITLHDAHEVLTALDGLSLGRRAAGEELLGLSLRYHQDETVEVLHGWLRSSVASGP